MKNFKFILFALVSSFLLWQCNSTSKENLTLDYGSEDSQMRNMQTANHSPYAMFGDSSVVLMMEFERTNEHEIIILPKNNSKYSIVKIDLKIGAIKTYDKDKNLINGFILPPQFIARFLSVDPRAEKYQSWSPYNYVLGNPIRNIDPNGDTVRIIAGNDDIINWTPGMQYNGFDEFVCQTVSALNLLNDNRTAGNISLLGGQIQGNILDFATDRVQHVSIRNMWLPDGTAYNPMAAATSIAWTNESGTEILFDPYTGVHVGELSPKMAENGLNSYHTPGNLSPTTLLGHELGHAWLSQYAPDFKNRLRASPNDVEHSGVIHGPNGIETNIGMAIDGAARIFRDPEITINPPRIPGKAALIYYDYIITTNGSTSNTPILNRYNH